ncbi:MULTISPECIES: hypothetical protein [Bradyrhizobium]|uniref:hypothetical protein n=1 Tax=Bradyrhizobium TaxID=374 RepID=UPI0008412872|nr:MULTISPECIES: hypothetical protein [Bradyrhizobium]MCP1838264.1 hypothetical protein [Bradyrhizobium sp. USDA 4538]MCP1898828.1 hypothetical protein [Bradyrhizobium sp. USDA 4537]MCP1909323.1 hypothetical protein [Bradyrhizobium elkanii]MCP1987059.1 hypothetical protein [Bradyrhizobium sp. USDA 4539]ODM71610.1 hypothetical protein A6X20_40705 [Bradyrhizobium elkanii]
MNAENNFAARLLDAGRLAAIARICGLKADVSYYVDEALKELWRTRSPEEAKAIAERWVLWDAKGKPWPRMPPLENVVPFNRTGATKIWAVNRPRTPLQAIRDWFEKQDEDVRCEIAGMAALLIFEGGNLLDFSSQEWCDHLRRWLSETGLPNHKIIGRALTFRTCFEYFSERRFTEAAWTRSQEAAVKILEDAGLAPNSEAASLAPIAQKMLETLPARKCRWIEVGKSWSKLADTSLAPRALRVWSASYME